MGTPPEAWIRLLIVNAENGHRASTLALELAHAVYLETNREVPRSLSSWSARELKKPPAPGPGRPTVTERDRRIGWLLQLLYVPRRMAKEAGLSSRRLPIKRKKESERDLCICDAVVDALNRVPGLPSNTYDSVLAAWRHTRGKHRPRPDLLAETGVDLDRLAEVGRRYVRSIGWASDTPRASGRFIDLRGWRCQNSRFEHDADHWRDGLKADNGHSGITGFPEVSRAPIELFPVARP